MSSALFLLYIGYKYMPYIYTASTYFTHFYSYTKKEEKVPKEFVDSLNQLNENLLEIKENLEKLNKKSTIFQYEVVTKKEIDKT